MSRVLALGLAATTAVQAQSGVYLIAEIGAYPGVSNTTLTPEGTVKVSVLATNSQGLEVSYDMTDLAPDATGGLHVHTGTTCESALEVGGHFWNKDEGGDPWNNFNTTHTSNANGTAVGNFPVQGAVIKYSKNLGHAVVVHDASGARVGCGLLTKPQGNCSDMPAICSTECVPCQACPPDSEDPNCAACAACSECYQYESCVAKDDLCDMFPAACKPCDACVACVGGAALTPECKPCEACDVCSPFNECMEVNCAVAPPACSSCEVCLPCEGVDSEECAACAACQPCYPYKDCIKSTPTTAAGDNDRPTPAPASEESGAAQASAGAAVTAALIMALFF